MDEPLGAWSGLTVRLYGRLLGWYPPRFRREFAGEIHAVFQERMAEGGQAGFALQELAELGWSILRERWHERRKGEGMNMENDVAIGGGGCTKKLLGG
ncbi:MAG: hypothetical protein GYA20_04905 [Chloroflexi bacterium]|nr:hypothetical protein [Chloroflexota bacterium]